MLSPSPVLVLAVLLAGTASCTSTHRDPSPSHGSDQPHAVAPTSAPKPSPAAEPTRQTSVSDDTRRPREPAPEPESCGTQGVGERFAVRGVAPTDVLNVRAKADPRSPIMGQLPHDAIGILATHERRKVGASIWREIACGKVHGWVNERFLVHGEPPGKRR